jgi:translation initiation factor 1
MSLSTLQLTSFFVILWMMSVGMQVHVAAFSKVALGRSQNRVVLQAKASDANNGKKPMASISSSNGAVSRPTGSLGKPSKKKQPLVMSSTRSSKPLSKNERQRTANGTIDSSTGASDNDPPAQQSIQVVRGNRGDKTVTIIRGMKAPSVEEKKEILKTLKTKLGVGGTLVEGVLELQGDHTTKVVEILKAMEYTKARKMGK